MGAILITRPRGQAGALTRLLEGEGYRTQHCPALIIEPLPLTAGDRRQLLDLDQFHAVFFVSANAARLALDAMADLWPQWPVGLHWLAVGGATAAVIADAGLTPEAPSGGFNSEAVLALPCLAEVTGRQILICRGETGRDWLAGRLRDRGADVRIMPFYRRLSNPDFVWPPEADTVMVTSRDGWQAIAARVPARARIVAAGERVAAAVVADHPGTVVTARSAHDADMAAALVSGPPR